MHHFGDIVLIRDLLDPHGRNPKDRPCVVVTDPANPRPPGRHLVVAISTVVPDLLPDFYVLLPYQQPRHPKTGLTRRNAAILRWVEEIDESRMLRELGIVPNRQLAEMVAIFARLDREGREEETSLPDPN